MKKERYPAERFRAWLDYMKNPDGSSWTKSQAARELGCGRNQIALWEGEGAPYYIGLACYALSRGRGPWDPDARGAAKLAPWARRYRGRVPEHLDDEDEAPKRKPVDIPWKKLEPFDL